jgi:hypothetical protein
MENKMQRQPYERSKGKKPLLSRLLNPKSEKFSFHEGKIFQSVFFFPRNKLFLSIGRIYAIVISNL